MAFTSRRGRPKTIVIETDKGTPELRRKRQLSLTIEPLDWLRQEDYISEKQHWCGLHLRWLYTLRYGTCTPQSLDAAQEKGILRKNEYEEWQTEREQEWQEAALQLEEHRLLKPALMLCVYLQNVPPRWQKSGCSVPKDALEALSWLERQWCRNTTKGGAVTNNS